MFSVVFQNHTIRRFSLLRWKMHKTGAQAAADAGRLKELVEQASNVEVMIAPPFTALIQVGQALQGSRIALGAQNLYWEPQGAFTGEISPLMLQDLCTHVVLGHSERRAFFGENDAGETDR